MGTAPAVGFACRCNLNEFQDMRPVLAVVTAYARLSLDRIGLGWSEQGRAGTSSG